MVGVSVDGVFVLIWLTNMLIYCILHWDVVETSVLVGSMYSLEGALYDIEPLYPIKNISPKWHLSGLRMLLY